MNNKSSNFKINLDSLQVINPTLKEVPQITFQEASPVRWQDENKPQGLSNNNSDEEEFSFDNDENNEDDDEDSNSDTASEFSFELGGINGRASSVKYYSKPGDECEDDDEPQVYIDDLYDDENFDDDMNYYEDSSNMDDNENEKQADSKLQNYNDLFELSDNDVSNDRPTYDTDDDDKNTSQLKENGKPISKYEDLFALSDEDGENDADNEIECIPTVNIDITDEDEQDKEREHEQIFPNSNKSKNVNNYNDLFELSDEDESEDGENNANLVIDKDIQLNISSGITEKIKPNKQASIKHKVKITKYKDLFALSDEEDGLDDVEGENIHYNVNDENAVDDLKLSLNAIKDINTSANYIKNVKVDDYDAGVDQSARSLAYYGIPKTPSSYVLSPLSESNNSKTPINMLHQSFPTSLSYTPPLPPPARSQS